MANVLVLLQFVILALCFYPWPSSFQINWGLGFILAAVFLGVTTLLFNRPGNFNIRPEYKPGGQLILQGSYRFFRHPMYVSVILAALGAVLMQLQLMKLILVAFLFLVLEKKARLEEVAMSKQFPEYSDYMEQSYRWLPFNFNKTRINPRREK